MRVSQWAPALIQGTEERSEQQRRISHCGSSTWCQVRYAVSEGMYGKMETRGVLLPRPQASSRSAVLPQANGVGNKGKATFSKCMQKPRHMKWYCSGFKQKDVILLAMTVLKRYCPLPQKLFTRYCSIWETAMLEQGKMEK